MVNTMQNKSYNKEKSAKLLNYPSKVNVYVPPLYTKWINKFIIIYYYK